MSASEEDHSGVGERLAGVSRRAFLRVGGMGVAAAGAVAAIPGLPGLLSAGEADAPAVANAASEAGAASPAATNMVARVIDASSGELHLYFGEEQVVVKDPSLVNQLSRAAGH